MFNINLIILTKGSFAITSLMVYSCIERLEGKYFARKGEIANATIDTSQYLSDDPTEAKIMISMTVTFLAGLIQVKTKIYLFIH